MINTIQRRIFDTSADLSNPQARAKWMMDLSLMLDDIVGAVNTPMFPRSELVWGQTITSAVTSVTSPTLDGNTDKGYIVVFDIVSGSASQTTFSLFANGDTTNTNYETQLGNTAQLSSAVIVNTNSGYGKFFGFIGSAPVGNLAANLSYTAFNNLSSLSQVSIAWHKKATVTNLTSITLTASQTNGIGINSSFRLIPFAQSI